MKPLRSTALPGVFTAMAVAALSLCGAAAVHYVWPDSPAPLAPYTTWDTAAHTIQAAVDVAAPGSLVLVTNAYYSGFGGMTWGSNVVQLTQAVQLESVGGPARITGSHDIRPVYLTNGASISGFQLQFGSIAEPGAGVFCDHGGVVTNCTMVNNTTSDDGGGAFLYYGGTLVDCTINDNVAGLKRGDGGGVFCYVGGVVRRCRIEDNKVASNEARGGGVFCYLGGRIEQCRILYNKSLFGSAGGVYSFLCDLISECSIVRNEAERNAGGIYCHYPGIIRNCLIISNTAGDNGGGVYCSFKGTVQNCTITANTARDGGGIWSSDSTIQNCIIWNNSASNRLEYGSRNQHNCIEAWTSAGVNVTTQDPRFVAGNDVRLAASSPCRNTGTNLEYVYTTCDVDGQRRIMGAAVDRGAYEFVEATPPIITSAVVAAGVHATPFYYRIAAHFAPTNFAAVDLPAGLAVEPTNGVIAGMPVGTGLYSVAIIAANTDGACTGQLLLCVAATNLIVAPQMTESIKTIVTRTKAVGGVIFDTARRGQTKCLMRARCDLPIDFTTLPFEPFVLVCGDLRLTLCFTNFTVTSAAASYTRTLAGTDPRLRLTIHLKKTARLLLLALSSKNPNDLLLANNYAGLTTNITTQLGATVLLGTRGYLSGGAPCAGSAQVKQKKIGRGDDAVMLDLPRVALKTRRGTR